jgi:cyclic pyranopterin phosphate synthase
VLVDPHGRVVRDLRISVTDRCNFRCTYCMPEEGMEWLPRSEVLTFEEIARVARICVERFGFDGIRLTGGEPTVRAHLPVLVEKLAGLGVDLSMTTNGATLRLLAEDLRAAGLRRVNVSLDSLRPERFLALTRRDALDKVLDGIDAAIEAGFDPVKVNCVLVRGVNDDEVVDFARFGRSKGVTVRFIEFMPLDADGAWSLASVVPCDEIVAAIDAEFPLEAVGHEGAEPAARWRYRDGGGEVGVVASVTQSFCGSCDRVRLTAEGQFRNCLFAVRETDLRAVLRAGGDDAGSDDAVASAIEAEVGRKWAGHAIGQVTFVRPNRSMSQIGG